MAKDVFVMLCCNNPDNGEFSGRLSAVEMFGLSLACQGSEPAIKFRGDKWLSVSRKTFAILGWRDSVGNWCWNGATMDRKEAKRLFRYLAKLGKFSPESGPTRMWEFWEKLK